MDKQDIFEALKGNVKTVNLTQLLEKKQQAFIDWVTPYYTAEDLVRLNKRKMMYGGISSDFDDVYLEPTWPKGKVRVLSKQYQHKKHAIYKLKAAQKVIITLAFPDYDEDWDSEYSVDKIVVRKQEL